MKKKKNSESFNPNKTVNSVTIHIDNVETEVQIQYKYKPTLEFTITTYSKGKIFEQKLSPKNQTYLFSKDDILFPGLNIQDQDKETIANYLDAIMNQIFD